uniref:Uncharacterized protein n=1 Tax=Chromera velia CCMP2878 TaxID=1169474 RepID=A0A0G4HU38_9ALVE|eukprot:Cvel_8587.t1-p1 / transcript=Cvel_8587.t1 / gene=Cvel_8587 / organism=Chromera_velia_CCMP2878 / gene_product=hypothetical protein / transcript_product=hypothetical protein / location=Cvel_scaffold476:74786-76093(-) / protein_length=313 / sequence_SO=supercontig / SO=protein_coding / is_pseudo=false
MRASTYTISSNSQEETGFLAPPPPWPLRSLLFTPIRIGQMTLVRDEVDGIEKWLPRWDEKTGWWHNLCHHTSLVAGQPAIAQPPISSTSAEVYQPVGRASGLLYVKWHGHLNDKSWPLMGPNNPVQFPSSTDWAFPEPIALQRVSPSTVEWAWGQTLDLPERKYNLTPPRLLKVLRTPPALPPQPGDRKDYDYGPQNVNDTDQKWGILINHPKAGEWTYLPHLPAIDSLGEAILLLLKRKDTGDKPKRPRAQPYDEHPHHLPPHRKDEHDDDEGDDAQGGPGTPSQQRSHAHTGAAAAFSTHLGQREGSHALA